MTQKAVNPGFLGRLRFYVAGLAIGCVLMGMFQLAKKKEARDQAAAAERARAERAATPDPLFPPLPEAEQKPPPGKN